MSSPNKRKRKFGKKKIESKEIIKVLQQSDGSDMVDKPPAGPASG
jgi:hypothetical protein